MFEAPIVVLGDDPWVILKNGRKHITVIKYVSFIER